MANYLTQVKDFFFGRKANVELEQIATVSRILQETMRMIQADVGLVTATGRSGLEESKGLAIFKEMSRDSQIKAALSIKRYAVLAGKWSFEPYDDSDAAKEQVEFITWNMKEALGDRAMGLEPIMTAFQYGRAVCEKVIKPVTYGKWKGKYALQKIKPKNIGMIEFITDEFGNITSYRCSDVSGNTKEVKPEKVIHYAWEAEFDNPYGTPDLLACYPWFWAKKTLYKYFMIFADKYASPIPVVQVEKALTDTDEKKLDKAAKDYHISNFFKLPKGVKLEMHQNNGTAGTVYIDAIRECDAQITKAILGQTLATNENIKSGTHAQAKVHQQMMDYILAKVQNDIEKYVVQEQIIKPLIDLNFANVEGYPKFQFQTLDPEHVKQMADALKALTETVDDFGNPLVNIREPWIREQIGLPARDENAFPWRDELPPMKQAEMDLEKEKMASQAELSKQKIAAGGGQNPSPEKKKPTVMPVKKGVK